MVEMITLIVFTHPIYLGRSFATYNGPIFGTFAVENGGASSHYNLVRGEELVVHFSDNRKPCNTIYIPQGYTLLPIACQLVLGHHLAREAFSGFSSIGWLN